MLVARDHCALLSSVLTCNADVRVLGGAFPALVGRLSLRASTVVLQMQCVHVCTRILGSICQSGWHAEGPICLHYKWARSVFLWDKVYI